MAAARLADGRYHEAKSGGSHGLQQHDGHEGEEGLGTGVEARLPDVVEGLGL